MLEKIKVRVKALYEKFSTLPNWIENIFWFLAGAAYHALVY